MVTVHIQVTQHSEGGAKPPIQRRADQRLVRLGGEGSVSSLQVQNHLEK